MKTLLISLLVMAAVICLVAGILMYIMKDDNEY